MFFFFLQNGFHLIEIQADNNTITPVGVFPWLHDPRVVLIYVRAKNRLLHFFYLFGDRVKIVQEFKVLIILEAILYVESQRQVIENLFVLLCVEFVHETE